MLQWHTTVSELSLYARKFPLLKPHKPRLPLKCHHSWTQALFPPNIFFRRMSVFHPTISEQRNLAAFLTWWRYCSRLICAILEISLNGACVWLTPLTDVFGGKIAVGQWITFRYLGIIPGWNFPGGGESKTTGVKYQRCKITMFSREKVRIISLTISYHFTSWTSEGGSAHFHEVKQAASGSTHSVCTGRATSCSNTLRRQIASCVLHNFCGKSVSTRAFCSCNKSQKIKSDNLCDLLRRQNCVAETKIFIKILQHTQSDLSLRRVATTFCFHLSPSMYRPSLKL